MAQLGPAPIQTPQSGLRVIGAVPASVPAQLDPSWQSWFAQASLGWQTWTPTWTASAPMTISGITVISAAYLRLGPLCIIQLRATFTLAGTPSNIVAPSLPIAVDGDFMPMSCLIAQPSTNPWNLGIAYTVPTFNQLQIENDGAGNFGLGTCAVFVGGAYRCAMPS